MSKRQQGTFFWHFLNQNYPSKFISHRTMEEADRPTGRFSPVPAKKRETDGNVTVCFAYGEISCEQNGNCAKN
jgi:hypothetical protein